MVERTAQIESHIEATREHLGANLDALEQKIKSATDWREHFERHPMTLAGAAFAGGVVLAMATNSAHNRPGRRGLRNDRAPRVRGPHAEEVAAMLDNIKGTLIGLAVTKVRDMVGQVVPGFQDEFDRRQRSRPPHVAGAGARLSD